MLSSGTLFLLMCFCFLVYCCWNRRKRTVKRNNQVMCLLTCSTSAVQYLKKRGDEGDSLCFPHVCTQNGKAPMTPAWKQLVQSLEAIYTQMRILFSQTSQDALHCKQKEALGTCAHTALLTGQILRNQQNVLVCAP